MRKSIFVISILFVALLWACSDENTLITEQGKEQSTSRTITFSLSLQDGDGFSLETRSSEKVKPVDPKTYAVYMYLFKSSTEGYVLDRQSEKITTPLYSIEGIEEGMSYAYLFAAVPNDYENVLSGVRDFGTVDVDEYGSFIASRFILEDKSSLNNCFIPFFEIDQIETEESMYSTIPIEANRDLKIFADGNYIPAGVSYHTPVNLVMTRQFGMVEIELDGTAVSGKEITCSVNSDYYRLYLSQMIKNEKNYSECESYYTSQNEAKSIGEISGYINTDYFSVVNAFVTFKENLPTFTKTITVNPEDIIDGKYYLQLYLPYTTAYLVSRSTDVPTKQNANYIMNGPSAEATPGLTLTMNDTVYKYNGIFPIHRNAKTTFYIQGSKLTTKFGDDEGIDLDDDDWDGIN